MRCVKLACYARFFQSDMWHPVRPGTIHVVAVADKCCMPNKKLFSNQRSTCLWNVYILVGRPD